MTSGPPQGPCRPTVGIVVPSLNQARFIGRTLNSLFSQDYPAMSVHVQDGGSTDGTVEVLKRLAQERPGTFTWVSVPDGGQANAINRGFAKLGTDILAWLNSDDILAPGAVTRAASYLGRHQDRQIVYGEGIWIDEDDRPVGRYPSRSGFDAPAEFAKGCFICQPTVFLRRSFLDAIGPLDESFHVALDFELWVRAAVHAPGAFGYLPSVQAFSRLHMDTKTSRERARGMVEALRLLHRHLGAAPLHWVLSFLDECALSPPDGVDRWKALGHLRREIRSLLAPADRRLLSERIRADMRLRLSGPWHRVLVEPDGWAAPEARIYVAGARLPRTLDVSIDGAEAGTRVTVEVGGRPVITDAPANPAPVRLTVPIPADTVATEIVLRPDRSFVPARLDPTSHDPRSLGFRVNDVQLRQDGQAE